MLKCGGYGRFLATLRENNKLESKTFSGLVKNLSLPALDTWNEAVYRTVLLPAFHEPCAITVGIMDSGGWIQVSDVTTVHKENLQLNTLHFFNNRMNHAIPRKVASSNDVSADGIQILFEMKDSQGYHQFHCWNPTEQRMPNEFYIISSIFDVALQTFREIELIEQIYCYIYSSRLPVKVFDELPKRIRIFGRISSKHKVELSEFFAQLPLREPLQVDMRNCEVVAGAVAGEFTQFSRRIGETTWMANGEMVQFLKAKVGIDPRHIREE